MDTACGAPCPVVSPDVDPPAEAAPCVPSDGDPIVICPARLDGLIAIPDVGVETFYKTADEQSGRYPDSTIAYQRWWWRELEPSEGVFDFEPIDDLLDRATAAHQDIALRVMPEGSGEVDVPQWLVDEGLGGVRYGGGNFSPDYDDERYLVAAEALVAALGAHLNGNPRLAAVDIGMVGQAGEWHVSGGVEAGARLPRRESWQRIIDAHVRAFPDTPLLMLVGDVDDGGEPVRYAVEQGAGWRADCLGDNRTGWNHMDDFYLQRVAEAELGDVWKTAPVHFETCGDLPIWRRHGVDAGCQLDYALGLHTSALNPKSRPVPRAYEEDVDRFLARSGYRLSLTELRHPATVQAGDSIPITTRWLNSGVAPPYRPFRLAVRWSGPGAATVVASGSTIVGWLPGETTVEDTVLASDQPGTWTMSLAILGVHGEDVPRVPLGIGGADETGWTPISSVVVE